MQHGLQKFRVVKDEQTGLYGCHLCNYKSAYGSSLRSHLAVHSNVRPYGCDMCSYEAKRLPDLKKHKILKHIRRSQSGSSTAAARNPLQIFRDPSSGLYRCQHCSYHSDNARCVRSHLAVHSELRPYACDACSYEAKRSSDLSKHKIIKHGRVPCRRNKVRKTTTEINNAPTSSSSTSSLLNININGTKTDSQQELDRSDVLSDLDYSLMSPTRAALEALRRCNMEPLDMFEEYSDEDSFSHNTQFPQSEIPDYNTKRSLQSNSAQNEHGATTAEVYLLQGLYEQKQHETVFVKPEPPDDYFNLMQTQRNNQSENSQKSKTISSEEKPVYSDLFNETFEKGSDKILIDSVSLNEVDFDRIESNTSPESSESHSSNNTQKLLERKNVSGSSLIRPALLSPRSADTRETERSSSDSQSRESGYSSPNVASPNTEPSIIKFEVERQTHGNKTTETHKSWSCLHCDIMFFDGALYFMHMGLHNTDNPWTCNMCSVKFHDVYGFTSHFVNGHSRS